MHTIRFKLTTDSFDDYFGLQHVKEKKKHFNFNVSMRLQKSERKFQSQWLKKKNKVLRLQQQLQRISNSLTKQKMRPKLI